MARENTVLMYGRVAQPPVIKVTEEGEVKSVRFRMMTLRRSYQQDLMLMGENRFDYPIIFSRNQQVAESICDAKIVEGDMVYVKGTLCTKSANRVITCPHCGKQSVRENATVIYVDPIFVGKWEEKVSEQQGRELLMGKYEISNLIFVWGRLCQPPKIYNGEHKKECDFQIATNRIRRIKEDPPDVKTDYPWVKTFGNMAVEASMALQVGSEIHIHGSVETRQITKDYVCPYCGGVTQIKENPIEIVPYNIEYGENCKKPDPILGYGTEEGGWPGCPVF